MDSRHIISFIFGVTQFQWRGRARAALTGTVLWIATNGSVLAATSPLSVVLDDWGVHQVATFGISTCALTSAGSVKCWGYNSFGQLGDGTTTPHSAPADVKNLTNGVTSLAAGYYHACAIMGTGGVVCWGRNGDGQLGDNTDVDRPVAAGVNGLQNGTTVTLAAGLFHTCALTNSKSLKCWGNNSDGQLGDTTTTSRRTPVDVVGIAGVVRNFSVGAFHTCAVLTNGDVKCWGRYDGATPASVPGLAGGITATAAGSRHTCALTAAGGVKCWGSNDVGQLGDGTTAPRSSPLDVTGLTAGVTAIAAGELHTCALMTSGHVKCWGYNAYGQIGDGTASNRLLPVDVSDLPGITKTIVGSAQHTCAVSRTGGLKCWGGNVYGQLGDGTNLPRPGIVDTLGLGGAGGSVTSTPLGINCGSYCNAAYASGTAVTLTPVPSPDYVFAGWLGACSGTGPCTVTMNAAKSVTASFALATLSGSATPGDAAVVRNPYGPITVFGATLTGNTISNFADDTVVQLGPIAGAASSSAEFDVDGLNIGTGVRLAIRSGAPGQTVVLANTAAAGGNIAGMLSATGGNGASPPAIYVKDPNGLKVYAGGSIVSPTGLALDTLGVGWTTGRPLVNNGIIDGGTRLDLFAARIGGSGAYQGDNIALHTVGNVNNPANGAYFLDNGVQLYSSTPGDIAVTLNAYGATPQVINLMINGGASVWMPSTWPAGSTMPVNNAVVPTGGKRPTGSADPVYGGGSMIIQTRGSLALFDGGSHDFVFPGGIVLKAEGSLDLNGVLVNQGWTTSGKSFQGVFFESASISSSSGAIRVYGNDLNWINFSTLPATPVRTLALVRNPDSSASFFASDGTAPHVNAYSTLSNTAAAGGCWTCIVNSQPVNMSGVP